MRYMHYLFALFIVLCGASQALAKAELVPAFSRFSSASGSVDAGKQGTNTIQVPGATFGKVDGKPTMVINDVVTKGDPRYYMDGKNGRPTLAQWQANQTTTDTTLALQAAIDSGYPVTLPKGTFLYSQIILRDLTSLIGAGNRKTVLLAAVSYAPYTVLIDSNYVRSVKIQGIEFTGNASNVGQGCFYIYGQKPAPPLYQQGGLWWTNVKDVRVDGYSGNSIWLRGGTDDYLTPNQFLTFENVQVFRTDGTTSRSLLITGQAGQVDFVNCQFDGVTTGIGTNVELSREFFNSATGITGGSTVGGTAVSDMAPIAVSFLTTTFQHADYGVVIDRAQNIVFSDSCWFEQLWHAIKTSTASRAVVVANSHFANAGSNGAGGGYLLSVGSTSSAVFMNNDINGAYDTALVGATGNYGIVERSNIKATQPIVAWSTGLTPNLSVAGDSTLNTQNYRFVVVNGTATPLSTITSQLGIGESVTLYAASGSVTLDRNGNIQVPFGANVYTILAGETVTLTRQDLGSLKEYHLIAAPRRPSGSTASRPTLSGTSEAGVNYFDTSLGRPIWWNGAGAWVTGIVQNDKATLKTLSGVVTALTPAATVPVDLTTGTVFTLTPNQATTLTASNATAGQSFSLAVLTSGATSYTLTFGSGFKAAGTLDTGTVTSKWFIVNFLCPTTSNCVEKSRTAAL